MLNSPPLSAILRNFYHQEYRFLITKSRKSGKEEEEVIIKSHVLKITTKKM